MSPTGNVPLNRNIPHEFCTGIDVTWPDAAAKLL